jgi:ATP synthase protein I
VLGQQDKQEIRCTLLSQWLAAAFIAVVILIFAGQSAALSSVYGGIVSIIPTLIFARMLFRFQGARQAQRIVRSLYVGEGLKLLVTALLFGLVIHYLQPVWWAFFVSFILVHFSLCISPLFCVRGFKD